ncbi:MAG: triphosphoribosyl-dephospho-CoA synthase [Nitrososphaerales archaeon]
MKNFPNEVMKAAQLAALLEVSSTPKPGNVHRNADYPDTKFEHFLAGSIALGPVIRDVTINGMRMKNSLSKIGIGRYIKRAILNVKASHKGGNTHLGMILLFVPLAASAGLSYVENSEVEIGVLRKKLIEILRSTTVKDAIEATKGLCEANAALGVLEDEYTVDVTKNNACKVILKRGLTLYELMEYASEWDNIAKEWVTGLKISFELGYPELVSVYKNTGDINVATVHTFLKILAEIPDTFIARKVGFKVTRDIREAVKIGLPKAEEISKEVKEILKIGGLMSNEGKERLIKLDKKLRESNGILNPGTSADITGSSLMIALLCGLKF